MADGMPDAERLRERFIAEFEAGASPDPLEYLSQLEGADRLELEALLDAYLAQAPRRRFDPAAFAASPARALVDDLDSRSPAGPATGRCSCPASATRPGSAVASWSGASPRRSA